jgi:hypothetical protein
MTTQRRTVADLERAIRSISTHFNEDVVVVVGSQAALVGYPWTPDAMRNTEEIDIYIARVKQWEAVHPEEPEFHDEVEGLFGPGTEFFKSFGFYIDGVGIETAVLPKSWEERAVFREVKNGSATVTAVAPSIEDLIVSKLAAFREKDKEYIKACHAAFPIDVDLIRRRIRETDRFPEGLYDEGVAEFLGRLGDKPIKIGLDVGLEVPVHPEETHKAIWSANGLMVFIRKLDEETGLYYKVDNPLGPAGKSNSTEFYAIDGKKLTKGAWEVHPNVLEARNSRGYSK